MAGAGTQRRPDTFIIGAPKSATTSLYEYLSDHPAVYMSPIKEPSYFAPDVNPDYHRRFPHAQDLAGYLDLFAEARDEQRLGEASTRYMVSRVAAGLVREFQPAARIVALLRNPVDVIHARHNELVSLGQEDIVSFEAALAADTDRRAGRRLPAGTNPLVAVYREQVRYAEQLQRWIDSFGRERLHVIVFDDLVADTAAEFRRLLEFLEIDPTYRPPTFAAQNRSHRIRRGLVDGLRSYRPTRWFAHSLVPRLLGSSRAARARRRVRHTRLFRRPYQRPAIRPELRLQLEVELWPEVEQISRLLDRDLGALWFRPQPSTRHADLDPGG